MDARSRKQSSKQLHAFKLNQRGSRDQLSHKEQLKSSTIVSRILLNIIVKLIKKFIPLPTYSLD